MAEIKFLIKGRTPLVKIDGQPYHFTTFKKNADGTVTFTARPLGRMEVKEMKEVDPILGQIGENP